MMRVPHLMLLAGLLLAGCSTPPPGGGSVPSTSDYARPHKDGAPWWEVDVSQIPDAVPMPHYGRVKANPYTVMGKSYYPISDARNYRETGIASWYGTKFHNQLTANGERYDLYGMTAAHKTLPLPSYVQVTNLDNGRKVILRVNDRGPFYSDRIIDLSFAAAKKLGFAESGTARVHVEGIDPYQWWAERGQPVPQGTAPALAASAPAPAGRVELYSPPPQQHAAAVSPAELRSTTGAVPERGLYLQVGAFANPDAAELLRARLSETVSVPVFISSVVLNRQVLHRVRLGPIGSSGEAQRVQQSVRLANLGSPQLVRPD
ncbi:MAG TPA: septal ring lytic transglycosylase RlpA family protein [Pseudomonas sp.]|nr:septal ring lytic transglycosylase RlpA family protein [Pseudomonas sp.]